MFLPVLLEQIHIQWNAFQIHFPQRMCLVKYESSLGDFRLWGPKHKCKNVISGLTEIQNKGVKAVAHGGAR